MNDEKDYIILYYIIIYKKDFKEKSGTTATAGQVLCVVTVC